MRSLSAAHSGEEKVVKVSIGTRALVAAVVVVVAATAGGIAWAGIPDSGGVIHACYSANGAKGTGGAQLNIIDSDQASCSRGQTAVTWNQQGADGAPGISGYERIVRSFQYTAIVGRDQAPAVSVECPDGKKVLGGGGSVAIADAAGEPGDFAVVTESRPSGETLWTIRFAKVDRFIATGEFAYGNVYAICANVTS
jgi:hypothetical protein